MIKKITKEEFKKLALHGRGRSSSVYNSMLSLQVDDDALVIEKSSWRPKYAPTRIAKKIERKYGFRFVGGALPDRSGWAFQRVK
ncbi:MAG TPA: hypothetical protein VI757_13150 [Bacteroidia bacterium]|nr:hypothetical protein [Bacteroidia bacterium]